MDFSKRMNSKEAASYLGRSAQWLLKAGLSEITDYKIGGRYYFLKEDLDSYVQSARLSARSIIANKNIKQNYQEFSLSHRGEK